MKTADFYFELPEDRIACYPPAERGKSRLLVLNRASGKRFHRMVEDLPDILAAPELNGTCNASSRSGEPPLLVFNNSRVRKARLKAVPLGRADRPAGSAEFLLLNRIDSHTWRTMTKRAKRKRPGNRYRFEGGLEGEIVERPDSVSAVPAQAESEFRFLRFDVPIDDTWLDLYGHIPLPPYIKRDDESADSERYQTVYADRAAGAGLGPGASAAAPTAGLHFTKGLLTRLERAGLESVFVTLHVGLGTFLPVRTETIEDHLMHEEAYSVSEEAARRINAAKASGRKIIAVGTTSVRVLESAWQADAVFSGGKIQAGEGVTSIFIYPGYSFKAADVLFTNFHTPGSTLLMLAAAFAGRELILETYAEAIREGYRFFSYGDAMLIC
ncbi:S-adenosylmethionine:tRNA ribosyltransferase-isomerase [Spirochaetia bacterium]|nr:S-adenosylmethionine:tRNA ribosyltransferase-isomerase [Spirochaetia bacterium]